MDQLVKFMKAAYEIPSLKKARWLIRPPTVIHPPTTVKGKGFSVELIPGNPDLDGALLNKLFDIAATLNLSSRMKRGRLVFTEEKPR